MERHELARLLGHPTVTSSTSPTVVEERDPIEFKSAFARAVAGGGAVFLADTAWGQSEHQALAELVRLPLPPAEQGWLMIPSGGSGGRLKFARHDQNTLAAAIRGFCAHFNTSRVNCVGLLPLHHVSGLMAWMRTVMTGGIYVPWDWKKLEGGEFPAQPPEGEKGWFISLVPTQLQRLFRSTGFRQVSPALEWLRRFEVVALGGGPMWEELSAAAAKAELPISLSYGMTETAAMVTALRPQEFLAGKRSSGTALPHARIELTEDRLVRVTGESVFRGYFPELRTERSITTEDLGCIDAHAELHILGRRDAVIISGGKKIDPQEVEAALLASGEFTDVAVVGVPDQNWGQAAVACYPATQRPPDLARIETALVAIATFKHPRRYQEIPEWPRNAHGKLNRLALIRSISH